MLNGVHLGEFVGVTGGSGRRASRGCEFKRGTSSEHPAPLADVQAAPRARCLQTTFATDQATRAMSLAQVRRG